MLSAVQFHGNMAIGAQEVDFQRAQTVEGDWQSSVEAESASRFRQGLEAPIQERFRGAPRPGCTFGIQ
jgi:hypothetical protein